MADIIDYSQYERDLETLACSRLLSQFSNSNSAITPYILAMVMQAQDWVDINVGVLKGRSIDQAIGVQLDAIGRIVGLKRPLIDGTEILYFRWDDSIGFAKWDNVNTPWFVKNAPLAGLVPVTDSVYRQRLYAKIFKNQVSACSIPEFVQFVKAMFGINISLVRDQNELMAYCLVYPDTTPASIVNLLISQENNSRVQHEYFTPVAIGTRISCTQPLPRPAFRFDTAQAPFFDGWDAGKWSIHGVIS